MIASEIALFGDFILIIRENKNPIYASIPWKKQYLVQLPHQCDEWTVVAEENLEDAINDFQEFIVNANRILQELRKLRNEQ